MGKSNALHILTIGIAIGLFLWGYFMKEMPLWGLILASSLTGLFIIIGILGLTGIWNKWFPNRKQKLLVDLSKEIPIGTAILGDGIIKISNETEAQDWWRRVIDWVEEVRGKIIKVHPADAPVWEILVTFEPQVFQNVFNSDVNHKLTMLSEWIKGLKEYINRRTIEDKNG